MDFIINIIIIKALSSSLVQIGNLKSFLPI